MIQVRRLRTIAAVRARLDELALDVPVHDVVEPAGPLAQPFEVAGREAVNRFAILPMEGWDGTTDGRPTELVERRWRRFGTGGAGLIWGGEAFAVRPEARANPRQLCLGPRSAEDLAHLRSLLDPAQVCGLQLTHSGRFAVEPVAPSAHPVLERRRPARVLGDDDLDRLVDDYVDAARLAAAAGFDFVDVKACHGYLLHELLAAVDRAGRYGGDLEGRSRLLRTIVEALRAEVPTLGVGVRLSVFDVVPHHAGDDGRGVPDAHFAPYRHGFGCDETGLGVDLTEPLALLGTLAGLGVSMVCVTAGSPYYAPHIQRPAYFPPSDGYRPPEDPLVGTGRLLAAARTVSAERPELVVVGSGYSYLQEWLAHVAEATVAAGWVDAVGLGRMALSYPDLPADVLAGRSLERRRLCRTFSDCTTAPRHNMVSGCYPLDDFYRSRPERVTLARVKRSGAPREDDE